MVSSLGTSGLWPVPCREFAPAGDLLSGRPESRQRVAPAKPPLRGPLRCSNTEARAELASLRAAQTTARSQFLKRASLAPRRSALLGGLEGELGKAPRLGCAVASVNPADRVARATLYFSTGEPGVQPRVGRCDAGMVPLVTCHVRERSGSLLPTPRPAVARRSSCTWCSCAVQGLFFGDFLLAPQKKVTRPPGRTPGTSLTQQPGVQSQQKRGEKAPALSPQTQHQAAIAAARTGTAA